MIEKTSAGINPQKQDSFQSRRFFVLIEHNLS